MRSVETYSKHLTILARIGFAARGIVYLMIGWFAIDAARHGGEPSDNQGVLGSFADTDIGRLLLIFCAIGFAGYALWRLLEAVLDPERRSRTLKGKFERAGYALSGVVHAMLTVAAVNLALRTAPSSSRSPGDRAAQSWSSWLLDQPGGQMVLSAAGVVLLAVALAQAIKAYHARFEELSGDVPAPRGARWAGRLGYAARAVVFTLMGWFVINAALHENAREAGGMGAALRRLQDQEYGPLLLAVVAAGLGLFGIFSLVEAAYRHLKIVTCRSGARLHMP